MIRPELRSVTSARASGRNARPHGVARPVTTSLVETTVTVAGPDGAAGDGVGLGVGEALRGADCVGDEDAVAPEPVVGTVGGVGPLHPRSASETARPRAAATVRRLRNARLPLRGTVCP